MPRRTRTYRGTDERPRNVMASASRPPFGATYYNVYPPLSLPPFPSSFVACFSRTEWSGIAARRRRPRPTIFFLNFNCVFALQRRRAPPPSRLSPSRAHSDPLPVWLRRRARLFISDNYPPRPACGCRWAFQPGWWLSYILKKLRRIPPELCRRKTRLSSPALQQPMKF